MNNRRELLRCAKGAARSTVSRSAAWIDQELAGCVFSDVRLGKRFRRLVQQFSSGIGGSIPWACQDWANTKAAYRFFSNDRVSEADILAGHFQATSERLLVHAGPVLILHDTTQFSYRREDVAAIGVLRDCNSGRAFFQQSRDIGRIDVLADIAKEVGLDPEQFRAALEQGTYRDRVQQLLRTAYERVGVTAVPTMVIGRQRLEGLYPEDTIKQVIEGELGRGAESSG